MIFKQSDHRRSLESAAGAPARYQGFYINLDRSHERDEDILRQLERLRIGPRYRRFPAVDGDALGAKRGSILPGELGCFRSHAEVLARADPALPVHILEDDVQLSQYMAPLLDRLIAEGFLDTYDIIFTDTFVEPRTDYIEFFGKHFESHATSSKFSLVDVGKMNFCCLASYVVGTKSMGKLRDLYAAELEAGPAFPVDIFLRNRVLGGDLRAAVAIPFATTVRLKWARKSTIAGRPIDSAFQIANLLVRKSFFVERDLEELAREFSGTLNRPVAPAELLDQLTAFVSSPDRRAY